MEGIELISDLAVIMVAAVLAGLACRRVGLSPVVGYLVAGIVVGPYTPPFSYVQDTDRVQVLAQLGMVFLMFSIGMSFSLSKLRELGLPLVIATASTALVVFFLSRGLAAGLGLGRVEGLFLAGMLMVSSSAVIGKVLQETGGAHTRGGQMALGITLCEDIVAVVMITLLGSYVQMGESGRGVFESVGIMTGFILLLIFSGLLLVPWLLRRVEKARSAELETLLVAALLFSLALVAVKAGYSLALGAFLLGAVIAELPQRNQVDRVFVGLKDIFSTVFFVAIGMSIDIGLVPEAWPIILLVAFFALIARPLAAFMALLLVGSTPKNAMQSGLMLGPLGEFSFIIAQIGVAAMVLPPKYYVVAVGASILTSLAAPFLIRHAEGIATQFTRPRLPYVTDAYAIYVNFIAEVRRRQQSSVLWMLCKKRLIQVGLEVLLVSTVLIFAPTLLVFIHEHLPVDGVTEAVLDLIFWITLGLFCLLPLQAIWRNIDAMAMIMIDFAAQSQPAVMRRSPYILFGLKSVAALLLILWLGALIPVESGQAWLLVGFALVLLGVLVLMRSKLIYWHSVMENSVESVLRRDSPVANHTLTSQLAQCADWPLELSECELPDRFALAGSTIAESGLRAKHGVSIVMIERQGMAISAPSPSSHLFPYDKLLLLGNRDDLPGARDYLTAEAVGEPDDTKHFGSLVLDTLGVSADSPRCGKTLGMLNLTRLFGVQVVGIERQGKRFSEITAFTQLQAEDRLLVLGTPARIEEFRHWLEREPSLI